MTDSAEQDTTFFRQIMTYLDDKAPKRINLWHREGHKVELKGVKQVLVKATKEGKKGYLIKLTPNQIELIKEEGEEIRKMTTRSQVKPH